MNKVVVYHVYRQVGGRDDAKSTRDIKRALERALKYLKKKGSLLEVYLINGREMRFLNKEFRGKDKSTNVLSFGEPKKFPHPETDFDYLGEIYLDPKYIKNKKEDPTFLAVHGLLHLLGYTHKRRRDTMKMQKYEQKLLGNV
ncbi:MAG: rRNA maturation RNase YbeY [Patescibacteria group bacterium]